MANKKITLKYSPDGTTFNSMFPETVIDQVDGLQEELDLKVDANPEITGGTKTKITYDSKGLVTAGSDLTASDIPNLDASKITSGQFGDDRISSSSTWHAKQDAISDLEQIRTNATAGAGAATTIAGYGNIVTHNTSEFATATQGTKADTAIQPGDNVSELTNDAGYLTEHQSLAAYRKAADQDVIDATLLPKDWVNDTVTSTSTAYALSANMGKELNDRIEALKARGRFLSIWNCVTGLPTTNPLDNPYIYKTGDYYIVGTVGETNYKPTGTQYERHASTTVETGTIAVNDTYYYDGNGIWNLIHTVQPTVSFSALAGSPYDNTNLTVALDAKQDDITSTNKLSSDLVDDSSATNKFVTEQNKSDWNAKSVVTVSSTGTSTDKVQYITINGVEKKMGADDPTEYTTKLQEDLYTYTPIGKITGASQTNPVKVADAGDPLKDVFNAILGTEVDVNPSISQSGTTFTKTGQTGTITEGGGEVGKSINAQTGVITFKVTNTGTCSYGLKAGTYDTYSKTTSTTFNYPIKTRSVTISGTTYNYQLAITYPQNNCTVTFTAGTLVATDTTNRVYYCNTDNNKEVKISIAMSANNSGTSSITRFGQLSANVQFDNPQYNGVNVDNFWTYLKASYTAQGMTPPAQKSASSTAYTINAGAYYPYYMQSDSATVGATLSGCTQTTDTLAYTSGADYTINKTYFYFVIPNAKTYNKIQQYITGQWNSMNTTSLGTTTLTLNTGATATYKVFRTDALVPSTLKLRINS